MNAKILLVDDDKGNLVTLEAILGSGDYELHSVNNGADACRLAETLRPDLILLDVMMPGMDGYAVCRHIRATPGIQSIPIIMLTALSDQASRLDGIRAGADDFLSKPCVIEEIRARVATITRLNRFRIIADQRARFERLFTLAPAAILMLDPTGAVVSANTKAADLFHFKKPAELTGLIFADICPQEAAEKINLIISQTGCTDALIEPVALRLVLDGEERIFTTRASYLDECDSRLVLLILNDVTAEVRAREEAESLNRRLDDLVQARTRQLKDANDLLMSYAVFISHDLRSPLSALQSYLSFLQQTVPVPDAETTQHCVVGAFSAAQMMGEMINGLLDLAQDEKDQDGTPPPPLDPKPIIERLAWKISSFGHGSPTAFTIGELPLIHAKRALIERVFYNLLINAIKFSSARKNPEIIIGYTATRDGTAIYVRDNGVGFDPEDGNRLFQAFSRLPNAGESDGFGLGLSLVSRLLQTHHARIWAESRPGEGATFFVQFPNYTPCSASLSAS